MTRTIFALSATGVCLDIASCSAPMVAVGNVISTRTCRLNRSEEPSRITGCIGKRGAGRRKQELPPCCHLRLWSFDRTCSLFIWTWRPGLTFAQITTAMSAHLIIPCDYTMRGDLALLVLGKGSFIGRRHHAHGSGVKSGGPFYRD
jgi:hypothetical protein